MHTPFSDCPPTSPEVPSEDMYLLFLIFGALTALIVAGPAILVAIVVVRHVLWGRARDRAEAEARRAKYRPDGQPYPPSDRALCDVCARVCRKVYYLESGQRVCEDCYRESGES